jgi:hypothetical protein
MPKRYHGTSRFDPDPLIQPHSLFLGGIMCVIGRNSDHFNEDACMAYLTWDDGQYAPAPSMFYVPGLRPTFQK